MCTTTKCVISVSDPPLELIEIWRWRQASWRKLVMDIVNGGNAWICWILFPSKIGKWNGIVGLCCAWLFICKLGAGCQIILYWVHRILKDEVLGIYTVGSWWAWMNYCHHNVNSLSFWILYVEICNLSNLMMLVLSISKYNNNAV
jgi:hypothetical protein